MSQENDSIPTCPKFDDPRRSSGGSDLSALGEFLSHMTMVLSLISTKGVEFLHRPNHFKFGDWKNLLDWVFRALYYNIGGSSVRKLFNRLVERGIKDLGKLIKEAHITDGLSWLEFCTRIHLGSWKTALEDNLCIDNLKSESELKRLIDMMRDMVNIPIYRKLRELNRTAEEDELFDTLATHRFPDDQGAQEMFRRDCVALANETV